MEINFKKFLNSNSAHNQDSFVLNILQEKKYGYYVEIGSGDYKKGSNTFLLEEDYEWKGIGLDTNSDLVREYNKKRKNLSICEDASQFNFDDYFTKNNFPNQIDYLQIDVDDFPENIPLLVLMNIPFSRYRFSVITFEHDDIRSWKFEKIKNLSRDILMMHGYQLVVREAGEDYWVDPLVIPGEIWQPLQGQHYRSSEYHKI